MSDTRKDELIFMIVCVLICAVIFIAAIRLKSEPRHIKIVFGVLSGVFCLLVALTIIATGRTYKVENFSISDSASKCFISKHKDNISLVIKGQEYVTTKDKLIYLDASSKEDEVYEVTGQKRVYETSAPEWLYQSFFLSEPTVSIEYVVTNAYISKAK